MRRLLVGGYRQGARAAHTGRSRVVGIGPHKARPAVLTLVSFCVVLAALGHSGKSVLKAEMHPHPTPTALGQLVPRVWNQGLPWLARLGNTHHTGARARKAAVRVTMTLTRDTSAQEETFDVPVIARGTFLGEAGRTLAVSMRGRGM